MESNLRTIAKALSWQALGLLVTGLIAWFHTGSALGALSFALSTAASGLAFFFIHERIWDRIGWGRAARRQADEGPSGEEDDNRIGAC